MSLLSRVGAKWLKKSRTTISLLSKRSPWLYLQVLCVAEGDLILSFSYKNLVNDFYGIKLRYIQQKCSSYLQRIICSNWNSELFQYRNIVMASHSLILVWQYHVIVDDRLDCDGRFVLTRRGAASLGAAASQHGDLRAEVVAVAAHGRVLVFGVGTQKSFKVPSSPFSLDFSLDLRDKNQNKTSD